MKTLPLTTLTVLAVLLVLIASVVTVASDTPATIVSYWTVAISALCLRVLGGILNKRFPKIANNVLLAMSTVSYLYVIAHIVSFIVMKFAVVDMFVAVVPTDVQPKGDGQGFVVVTSKENTIVSTASYRTLEFTGRFSDVPSRGTSAAEYVSPERGVPRLYEVIITESPTVLEKLNPFASRTVAAKTSPVNDRRRGTLALDLAQYDASTFLAEYVAGELYYNAKPERQKEIRDMIAGEIQRQVEVAQSIQYGVLVVLLWIVWLIISAGINNRLIGAANKVVKSSGDQAHRGTMTVDKLQRAAMFNTFNVFVMCALAFLVSSTSIPSWVRYVGIGGLVLAAFYFLRLVVRIVNARKG